jgi:hypothetical protein
MQERFRYGKAYPDAYKAMLALSQAVEKTGLTGSSKTTEWVFDRYAGIQISSAFAKTKRVQSRQNFVRERACDFGRSCEGLSAATAAAMPAAGEAGAATTPSAPSTGVQTMRTITTKDGTEIYYKDWGPKSAQPIVFHHGWPLSGDDWDTQMLYFLGKGLPRHRP